MERHDTAQPFVVDYVHDELDAVHRREVEQHLAICDACAAEVRDLALAFQSLGLAPEPVAPPPDLRARVLACVERERTGGMAPAPAAPARRPSSVGILTALAATLLLAVGAGLVVSLHRTNELRRELAAAHAESDRLTREVSESRLQADLAVSILMAPDVRKIELTGYQASARAVAQAYWSPSSGPLIAADRLPPPPSGRVYQVWMIEGSTAPPVSAGVIDALGGGRGILLVPPGRTSRREPSPSSSPTNLPEVLPRQRAASSSPGRELRARTPGDAVL